MKITEEEIKRIADEHANLSYNKDANPIDHSMITEPFIDGFKKALSICVVSGQLPNFREVEKKLLDLFGFLPADEHDGTPFGIDAKGQLKIFEFMDWYKEKFGNLR